MSRVRWPYADHDKQAFLSRIRLAETYLRKYGAQCVGKAAESEQWIFEDGSHAAESIEQTLWKLGGEYVRVDRVYFPEKPFLVLEFSETKEGPYEDADPFPYDLPETEFEQEIRISLGIVR